MNTHRPLLPRLLLGSLLFLCINQVSLFAGADEDRRARLTDQIQTLQKIVASTEKPTEKTRLEVKLERMQTELRILEERSEIERKQKALASATPSSPLQSLRERLRNLDLTVEQVEASIQEITTQRRALVAERNRTQDRLDALSKTSAESRPAAVSETQELLITQAEQVRTLALAREAEDARLELAREAARIQAELKAFDAGAQPILKNLVAAYTHAASGMTAKSPLEGLLASVESNLSVARANYDLGQQKVAKFDEELAILEKQTGFFRKDEAVERLLAIQRSQKKALVDRLPVLLGQVDALEKAAQALRQNLELIELETAAHQEQYRTLKEAYIRRLAWPALSLTGLGLLYLVVHFAALPAFYRKENLLLARRLARYGSLVAAVGILAGFLFEDLSMVAATLGVVSAALVIALQDVCTSVAGWFVIMMGGKFTIGDRLEIEGSTGDVVDIQLLRTTLIEVGQWMDPDHPTGRVIVIPNNFIFKGKVHNYSHHHSFIWDHITLTLAFSTPVSEAMNLFHKVLSEETLEEFHAAQAEAATFRKRYGVDDAVYSPRISTTITSDGVALKMIFVAHYRRVSAVKNRIHRRLIAELEFCPSIQLANTTYNILHAPLTTDAPAAIMGRDRDVTSRPPFSLGGMSITTPPPILPGR